MSPMPEPSPDSTISDLHRIREKMAAAFHGDLQALTADAQARQLKSGRKIIRRGELSRKAPVPKTATPDEN